MTVNWMAALESQFSGLSGIERVIKASDGANLNRWQKQKYDLHWKVDRTLLKAAVPFAWSKESIDAVHAASHSVPLDSVLGRWNLDATAAWWHFEEPIPLKTTLDGMPIRALNLGWFEGDFVVVCWCEPARGDALPIMPSQVWRWYENETLDKMLYRLKQEHDGQYGPGGVFEKEPKVGLDIFMIAAEWLSKFVLAGMAWLNQKVLVSADGHVERHRRKAFNKATGQNLSTVKIISLRRVERTAQESLGESREYACRWVVGGHWRNQPCGLKNADRRLTYIHPYVKGPDDKPLRIPTATVYEVNR